MFNSYGDTPVVHWASLTGSMASPGASTPTLSFKATGLPAIVTAHAEGYYEVQEVDIVEEEAQPALLTSFRNDLVTGHSRGGPVSDNGFWRR